MGNERAIRYELEGEVMAPKYEYKKGRIKPTKKELAKRKKAGIFDDSETEHCEVCGKITSEKSQGANLMWHCTRCAWTKKGYFSWHLKGKK